MSKFLNPAGELTLPATTKLFDQTAYFQTKSDLFVSDWFKDQILKYVHEVDDAQEVSLSAFDLAKLANDTEIRKELPEDHVFEDPSEFCASLAQMIDRQPNGEKGNLLVNGYWNIFYVQAGDEVRAVNVRWSDDNRRWYVLAVPLGVGRWREGFRVLSATA